MKQVEIQKISEAYVQPDGTLRYVGSNSGMNNLFLANGFNISPDDTCYSINDLEDLFTCIAYVISDKSPLSEKMIGFVDQYMIPYAHPLPWTYKILDNDRIVFTHMEKNQ